MGRSRAKPRRTCVGCRRVADQDDLVRIARRADGTLVVGRAEPGRGAYLCPGSEACFAQAQRRAAFRRALRVEVSADGLAALRARLFGR